jgi:polyhydroxyalkanoate synthase
MNGASLAFADAIDAFNAAASRARLHALAQAARVLHGQPPIAFIAGPAHPHTCVAELPLARLLRYEPIGPVRGAIVVVASLINKYYVLDLLPEISVIRGYQQRGYAVYVLDWRSPGERGPQLGFSDYVDGAIAEAISHAANAASKPPHLVGYCMGGTMAAIAAARRPGAIASLTLLASPIDFHASGILADWTKPERFDADLVIDALGNMPPWLMQSGFKLMNPVDMLLKPLRTLLDGADADRIRHVTALEAWLDDNAAFAGGVYRDYIKGLYQDNALVRGELQVGKERVDLHRISAPLLVVVANRDHIAAPPSSTALLPLVASTDRETLAYDTGHIGLTASKKSLLQLWPRVYAWTEARS